MQNPEDNPEGEEPTGEPAEEPGEEAAVEPAPETPEPSPPKATNEMKVVIILKDDKVMLGVQAPDCDPVYKTMKGSLAAALKQVPALVAEAKQKWETNPLNPKADLPEPPPSPTPAHTRPAQEPKPKVQPSFF